MVGAKQIISILGILLLTGLIFSSANATLTATVEVKNGQASLSKEHSSATLEYNINFYNSDEEPFYVSTLFFFGTPEFNPASGALTVPPKGTANLNLKVIVSLDEGRSSGSPTGRTTYQELVLFNKEGERLNYSVLLPVKIFFNETTPLYSAVKLSNVIVDQNGQNITIDPRQPFTISFTINNPIEKRTISPSVTGASGLPETIAVEKGTSTITFSNLQLTTNNPGNQTLQISFPFPDYTVVAPVAIEVQGFSNCVTKEDVSSSIFGKTYTATVTNEGTVTTECKVATVLSGIEKNLITDVTSDYLSTTTGLEWKMNMNSGDTKVFSYTVSYIPLIAIPFVVIFIGAAVWYFTRKIDIKKELVSAKRHPGFMFLKMQVHVKNLSGDEMAHVNIYEPLPAFIKEVKDFGTIHGTEVKKNNKHAIKWEIDTLKPKEERIFSYTVRTSIEVLGKMDFDPTIVEYVNKQGGKIEASGNALVIEVE
jgi:hypothetical protein